jgi:hypothetical protein
MGIVGSKDYCNLNFVVLLTKKLFVQYFPKNYLFHDPFLTRLGKAIDKTLLSHLKKMFTDLGMYFIDCVWRINANTISFALYVVLGEELSRRKQ